MVNWNTHNYRESTSNIIVFRRLSPTLKRLIHNTNRRINTKKQLLAGWVHLRSLYSLLNGFHFFSGNLGSIDKEDWFRAILVLLVLPLADKLLYCTVATKGHGC
jgi:hypothetical protein